ncbi:MAG: bifunctional phosphopantothenoylcysteine decarboxylase/phosphopantothenate--cysteine ligase CoaBC [Chromatiales bacterium]|nr:bifunctional phosphopantothenoylcysteine decarboxylase/phosphopantothenate--cysteine ligase CoaBC [Chromatiales bacterium]MDP6150642.1 bifunctional phosphopantothenoylcysteine decarboxylase/phosphopantothenate--cysteine ligase CoaBC [Gammaproteobacteria bacterium]MDP7093432.1 bifunctional phosphopantothenoylcysteine decarboxylase/phosphopantothenate--cysteine ligase CoaBC [Gammaproteobacteria bacterium]MDP7270228.1 bifunctional phosphopantothenoylcysteine decarboxylase/phosphopantothenate--cy
MSELAGRHVLLGVTGSIAAYKSPDIVRRLKDQGAEVRVVLTASAEKLVSPTVFQAVSGEPVRGDIWDEQAEAAMGHIELARWADQVLIAPATANLIAQLAAGSAENLLSTICLATEAPIALAPAMNQAMWRDPATQNNCEVLRNRNVRLIGPDEGSQACGDVGPGRMSEPVDIVNRLLRGGATGPFEGQTILVSAGPTREAIDPVRFVSNRSSGKMGFAMARAAADAGASVILVAGPVNLPTPPGVERIDVETTQQMFDAAMEQIDKADIYIGAAAISDYRPRKAATQKIKKSADTFTLEMVKSPDLLASISALDDGPFTVGFAAETEKLEEHAQSKLERKQLDMIIANLVGENICFDADDNEAVVLWSGGREALPRLSKSELARRLVDVIAGRYRHAKSASAA